MSAPLYGPFFFHAGPYDGLEAHSFLELHGTVWALVRRGQSTRLPDGSLLPASPPCFLTDDVFRQLPRQTRPETHHRYVEVHSGHFVWCPPDGSDVSCPHLS